MQLYRWSMSALTPNGWRERLKAVTPRFADTLLVQYIYEYQ
jgi:hypothetical protein